VAAYRQAAADTARENVVWVVLFLSALGLLALSLAV
jgi:hypothetical protein